jgi:hypothetical protein
MFLCPASTQALVPFDRKGQRRSHPDRDHLAAGDAVLLSRADYDALEETAHLLRVPANAKRLIESLQQARTGQREEHDLTR